MQHVARDAVRRSRSSSHPGSRGRTPARELPEPVAPRPRVCSLSHSCTNCARGRSSLGARRRRGRAPRRPRDRHSAPPWSTAVSSPEPLASSARCDIGAPSHAVRRSRARARAPATRVSGCGRTPGARARASMNGIRRPRPRRRRTVHRGSWRASPGRGTAQRSRSRQAQASPRGAGRELRCSDARPPALDSRRR